MGQQSVVLHDTHGGISKDTFLNRICKKGHSTAFVNPRVVDASTPAVASMKSSTTVRADSN